ATSERARIPRRSRLFRGATGCSHIWPHVKGPSHHEPYKSPFNLRRRSTVYCQQRPSSCLCNLRNRHATFVTQRTSWLGRYVVFYVHEMQLCFVFFSRLSSVLLLGHIDAYLQLLVLLSPL